MVMLWNLTKLIGTMIVQDFKLRIKYLVVLNVIFITNQVIIKGFFPYFEGFAFA